MNNIASEKEKILERISHEQITPFPWQDDGSYYPEFEKYGKLFGECQVKESGRAKSHIEAYLNFIEALDHIASVARQETEKAFGGCTKCYGKGYATYKEGYSTHHTSWTKDQLLYCSCDRGQQMQRVIKQARQEGREEAIKFAEELKKDWETIPPSPGFESSDPHEQYQCGYFDALNIVLAKLTGKEEGEA